jgi:hypothetical protein
MHNVRARFHGRGAQGAAGLLTISIGMATRLEPSSLPLQPALQVNSNFNRGRGFCGLEGRGWL